MQYDANKIVKLRNKKVNMKNLQDKQLSNVIRLKSNLGHVYVNKISVSTLDDLPNEYNDLEISSVIKVCRTIVRKHVKQVEVEYFTLHNYFKFQDLFNFISI